MQLYAEEHYVPTGPPDVVVGHVFGCEQLGREGSIGDGTIGMSCWTTACNKGTGIINWVGLPSVDHPVISVNLFRDRIESGSRRFEQIGQSWVKHGFGTSNDNECGFGCDRSLGDFNHVPAGCSDTYAAGQFEACALGPRSMIHPYTGVMPAGDYMPPYGDCFEIHPANDHRDHQHGPISHRVQVRDQDLMSPMSDGARFFAEGQYIVPHEYVVGNGNQNNNPAHREVLVGGPDVDGWFAFLDLNSTVSEAPAINAWAGATRVEINPAAGGRNRRPRP